MLAELSGGARTTSARIKNGYTALHVACYEGKLDVVRFLIEEMHSRVDRADPENRTPMQAAYSAGHHHIVRYLTGGKKGKGEQCVVC